MFEVRSLFLNTFAAYNGGTQARVWSFGYYTAQGAEQCDATWVEIDTLPGDTAWATVESYVKELNTQAPTVEEVPADDLPTVEEAQAKEFEEVPADSIPLEGLFAWRAPDTGNWLVSADLCDRRTYLSAPMRSEKEARAEVVRIAAMYRRLPWYIIRF